VSDLPISLPGSLEPAFRAAFDPPGKLAAALDALGPMAGREVLIVDAAAGPVVDALRATAGHLTSAPLVEPLRFDLPAGSRDAVVGLWSSFRGVVPNDVAEVDRVLRPGGRQLVVHDYGRDDVSRLHDERPEYGAWSHRSGPFLTGGFRVRVVHCFWEFPDLDATRAFLDAGFGERGRALGETLRRPRLSYNVAIYHRSRP